MRVATQHVQRRHSAAVLRVHFCPRRRQQIDDFADGVAAVERNVEREATSILVQRATGPAVQEGHELRVVSVEMQHGAAVICGVGVSAICSAVIPSSSVTSVPHCSRAFAASSATLSSPTLYSCITCMQYRLPIPVARAGQCAIRQQEGTICARALSVQPVVACATQMCSGVRPLRSCALTSLPRFTGWAGGGGALTAAKRRHG